MPGQHVEERGLAGAVRADEAVQLVGIHLQIEIGRDHQRSEPLVQPGHRQDRLVRIQLCAGGTIRLDRRRAWRNGFAGQRPVGAAHQAEHQALHALGRGEREQDHDRREDQPPAFGDRRQPVLQQDEGDGAPQRPDEVMHPAQHGHQQGVAGVLPTEVVGVGALDHEGQQAAGVADDAAHDHERNKLQAEHVVAQALRALLVVAQGLQRPAERRVRDAPQQADAQADRDDGEDVERPGTGEQRPWHVLQAVLAAGHIGPFVGDFKRDLGKRQRQQREIQTAAAQDDQRDDGSQHHREHDAEDQRHDLIRGAAQHDEGHGIAGATEEHRGAERHQAGVADQHAHAGTVQRVDGDLGNQRDRRPDQMPQPGQRQKDNEDLQDGMAKGGGHSNRSHRSPSRPRGRSSSISAMKTYITAPEADG